jgi:hypothetical protein
MGFTLVAIAVSFGLDDACTTQHSPLSLDFHAVVCRKCDGFIAATADLRALALRRFRVPSRNNRKAYGLACARRRTLPQIAPSIPQHHESAA